MTTSEVKELKKEVKKYIDQADERMVKAVYAMLEADQQEDWWDQIGEGEKAAIESSLARIEAGKTIPHDVVMKKYGKWMSK